MSMASALNLSLTKSFRKMELDINFINELVPYYINDRISVLIGDNLKVLSKSIEAWDHIEVHSYRNQIEKAILNLFLLNFQSFCKSNPNLTNDSASVALFDSWYKRLTEIKQKHVFYDYHHDDNYKNTIYCKLFNHYNEVC